MNRGFVPLLGAVLLTGTGALSWATDGFRTVTSEGARRLAIEREAPPIPDVRLVDQDGRMFSLGDYRGRAVLVDFIYTRCPTVCGVLGDDFRSVLAEWRGRAADEAVDLLSISFDPAHDDVDALKLYGERYDATAPAWRIAKPVDRSSLETLLRTFGVVTIPDGFGGFIHNSAVYLVNRQGHLIGAFDPDAPAALAAKVRRAAQG
mgnify:CR=1 FL=1